MAMIALQVVMPIIDMFCQVPGAQIILPLVLPFILINPINFIVLLIVFIACLITLYKKVGFKWSFFIAFIIYYMIMAPIMYIVVSSACAVTHAAAGN